MPRVPLNPKHPERTCWGCNIYCPADDLRCGNGTIRALHPIELFGAGWLEAEPADCRRSVIAISQRRVRAEVACR
jgi:Protein of unknown function (DUF3079)